MCTPEVRGRGVPREHENIDGQWCHRCPLVRWEGKLPVFQNTRQTVVPLREHRNETSSDTLYTITSIKKMDCSGNVRRPNLKEFFLFLYIDINYITTTREIRNSSFFLYMMNVSNRIKVRKVTQTTGAYINALPT